MAAAATAKGIPFVVESLQEPSQDPKARVLREIENHVRSLKRKEEREHLLSWYISTLYRTIYDDPERVSELSEEELKNNFEELDDSSFSSMKRPKDHRKRDAVVPRQLFELTISEVELLEQVRIFEKSFSTEHEESEKKLLVEV
jgi:hypothetical protein